MTKAEPGEEPGQVKFGVGPYGAPGHPKKGSENWFLRSSVDIIVPRGLIFGYVVDLDLALNSCFVNIRIRPSWDP